MDLKTYGPWALILGGSESLGASFAHQLAAADFNLILVARKPGPLAEVAETLRSRYGVLVRTLSLDLASPDVHDRIRDATDDIDVGLLIYNAGALHRTGTFLEGTLDDALRTIRVNTIGQTALCHHFGGRMADRGSGGIILIGSMASIAGSPGIIVYCGAKAYSQIFAEGLWSELKPLGVDVVEVPIGSMNSPSMERLGIAYGPEAAPIDPDAQAREILDNIANGPVFIPPPQHDFFYQVCGMDRRQASLMMGEALGHVTGVERRAEEG